MSFTIIKSDAKSVLSFVSPLLPDAPLVVEAGAFIGRDTITMSTWWPTGTIHAFEPVPELFEQLVKNTHCYSTIHTYPLALSNTTGTATFYVAENPKKPGQPSQGGSLNQPSGRLTRSPIRYEQTITVPTITLDAWALQHHVERIDFLWLDLQGHALSALQGAVTMLATIKVLYLELEFIDAYHNQASFDFVVAWLAKHNFYEIARDFHEQDSWFFGNLILIRK